jgi:DHA2 family multidrug resistance protein
MTIAYAERLHGWRFILFNVVLGLGRMIVLFGVGSFIALLPHVTGELGGVLPSFGTFPIGGFICRLSRLCRYRRGFRDRVRKLPDF